MYTETDPQSLPYRCDYRMPFSIAGERNETEYPIILESSASGNTVVSFGEVTDTGTNNTVSRIDQPQSKEN